MTDKIYVYHHNDVDGISAAAMIDLAYPAATKKFISSGYPVKVDVSPFRFMTNPKDVTVFIVDLSLTYESLTDLIKGELCGLVNKVIWIDHHETSIKAMTRNHVPYPKNFDTYVMERSCGALLTYEYLHPGKERPKFLGVIDVYDRHDGSPTNIKLATNLNLSLLSIPDLSPTSGVWRELLIGGDTKLQYEMAKGAIIHDYLDVCNKQFIEKTGVVTSVYGIECIAVNAQGTSILFDSVQNKFPLRLAWYFDGEQYKYSLYSDGSINCSEIAAKFGGGGHPGAAGFSSDQLLFVNQNHERYFSD